MRVPSQRGIGSIRVGIAAADLMACGLVSSGLKRHSRFKVVGHAASMADLFRLITTANPDVTLISCDLQDGKLAGLLMVPEILSRRPEMHVVVLIDRPEREVIVQAFRAGAKGVFDRSQFHFKSLCKCIVCVSQGQIWADTQQLKFLLQAVAQTPSPRVVNASGANLLTKREEDLVRLVSDGLGNRDIAWKLSLSEHTVKNYMFRIFNKLGISNRVELVLYALNSSKRSLMSIPNSESEGTALKSEG